ncbi:MAG: extracellular solute-binding protein, partial [Clostridia bacterium]|nr:extracellular solute-binding protein [Clostridia bacterium]
IEQDVRGNDLNPSQVAYNAWIHGPVRDNEGLYDAPFTFCFTEGENTITIIGARAQFAIAGIELYNTPAYKTYEEYRGGNLITENGYYELIQGETPTYTCDPALHPIYDRSSVNTIPADPILLKRNTMGGGNWASQGQYAVYTFNVPAEGWYKIAVRYRQNVARGLRTYRRLYVNGEVPFAEADCLTFEYSDYWQKTVLGEIDNDGEPYLFHLKSGKNEIRIEAITGPTGVIIAELDDMVYEFNYIYRKIIMITGLDPDPYRDYHLESDIPTLLPTFKRLKEQCESIKERLIEIRGGSSSSEVASLTNMSVQLKSLLKDPETIPVRLSMFKDNISALAALSVKLKEQPLELDYITATAKDVEEFVEDKGFFKNLSYKIKAYFATYIEDYNSVGSNAEGEDVLRVWVNLGRDQANLIKEMSDSDFTSQTGIRVKVSLVQQNLIQANIANDGPDVVLFVGGGDVVNLSAREALVDMSQFTGWDLTNSTGGAYHVNDYETVMTRFSKYAGEPYRFTDHTGHTGHYSIPITENFNMLFYRTDIFDELGLEPPKTWDDFYKVLTVLQNNNMQVGIPNGSDSAVDSGIFLTLLKQNGLSLYSDDLKKTNLDTTTALAAFKQWTGFYSQYSMPQRYDLYTRFRTGEMPMGFAGYTFVNQLNYAAPELKGLWEMTTIPGTVQEDGSVNNIVSGGGAGAIIYKRAVKRGVEKAAWAYIDWFTSEDAQAKYGFDIETLLGAAGRYDTANISAAERLPWSAKEWKVLKAQWDNMFINPVVIGDYYYSRNITFAFRNVVIYSKNPREMLLSYNKEINAEITTKRKEFNLEVDEK